MQQWLCKLGWHKWTCDLTAAVSLPGTTTVLAPCKCLYCGVEKLRRL